MLRMYGADRASAVHQAGDPACQTPRVSLVSDRARDDERGDERNVHALKFVVYVPFVKTRVVDNRRDPQE